MAFELSSHKYPNAEILTNLEPTDEMEARDDTNKLSSKRLVSTDHPIIYKQNFVIFKAVYVKFYELD